MGDGLGVKDKDGKNPEDQASVYLSARLHDEIRDLSALQWPEECCGLLIAPKETPSRIHRVVVARNVASDPLKTFEIDPQTLIDTYRTVRDSSEVVVGCFHSHPNGKVLPSNSDRARADEDGFLWLIVATAYNGALKSGMYRAQHKAPLSGEDGENIRYFRRCTLIDEDH